MQIQELDTRAGAKAAHHHRALRDPDRFYLDGIAALAERRTAFFGPGATGHVRLRSFEHDRGRPFEHIFVAGVEIQGNQRCASRELYLRARVDFREYREVARASVHGDGRLALQICKSVTIATPAPCAMAGSANTAAHARAFGHAIVIPVSPYVLFMIPLLLVCFSRYPC